MAKRKRSIHGSGSVYQRTSDGRWVAKFKVEATGKWRELYATTEKEALEKLQQAFYEQKQGTLVTATQQTLQAHLEHWLRAKRLELKDGTYAYYRVYIETYIIPALPRPYSFAETDRYSDPIILRGPHKGDIPKHCPPHPRDIERGIKYGSPFK